MKENTVIDEALALLRDGYSVTLPVSGRSMLPFIIDGRERVVLAMPGTLSRGMVVLAWVDACRYVLHRVEKVEDDRVTLMGDGNLHGREYCTVADVKALATHVVDASGKSHPLYTPCRRMAVEVWMMLLPVRRYLLAVYRLIKHI